MAKIDIGAGDDKDKPKNEPKPVDGESAHASGATFEENEPAAKVIVNSRPRVGKPEYTGSQASDVVEDKPDSNEVGGIADDDEDKPTGGPTKAPSAEDEPKEKTAEKPTEVPKPNVVKPDVNEADVKNKESDDEAVKSDDSQAINELAKAAADKKKAPADTTAQDKNVQNLIENKTYFVPIGQVSRRRNTLIFTLILVVILVAGAVGLMMAF